MEIICAEFEDNIWLSRWIYSFGNYKYSSKLKGPKYRFLESCLCDHVEIVKIHELAKEIGIEINSRRYLKGWGRSKATKKETENVEGK